MLYHIESEIGFNRERNIIGDINELNELIESILDVCDRCEVNMKTSNGELYEGYVKAFANHGIEIRFIALDDYCKVKTEIIDYIERFNKR